MSAPIVHLMTGSSTVRCGAPMRCGTQHPDGWDLGTVTVGVGVTCPDCLTALYRPTRAALAGLGVR